MKKDKSVFTEKIRSLLRETMTQEGMGLLNNDIIQLPEIWDRPSSSTAKYHKREDGSVQTIAEHTYEMLEAAIIPHESPRFELLGIPGSRIKKEGRKEVKRQLRSTAIDMVCASIVLHDTLKYGPENIDLLLPMDHGGDDGKASAIKRKHTTTKHPKLIADFVSRRRTLYADHYTETQTDMIIEALRFHAGKWSPDAGKFFTFRTKSPLTFFLHFLDMMSAGNKIKLVGG